MTNSIVPYRSTTPDTWAMIESMAPVIHASRMYKVSSPAAAATIMLAGHELGVGMTAAFDLIHLIDNKPSLSPRGALALLHKSPEKSEIRINRIDGPDGAYVGHEVYMKRRDGFDYTARFTMADAVTAGLVKAGSGWEKYPSNMCMWRAVGFAADVVFPDVLAGLKTADQYGADLSQTGDVIDGSWTAEPPRRRTNLDADIDNGVVTLETLIERYGADAVLAANDGQPPADIEELRAVAHRLLEQSLADNLAFLQ